MFFLSSIRFCFRAPKHSDRPIRSVSSTLLNRSATTSYTAPYEAHHSQGAAKLWRASVRVDLHKLPDGPRQSGFPFRRFMLRGVISVPAGLSAAVTPGHGSKGRPAPRRSFGSVPAPRRPRVGGGGSGSTFRWCREFHRGRRRRLYF